MDTDEEYVRAAIDLAREAVANGNTPFGSLLVVDGTVVERSRNTTVTGADITAHPELKLARWAARELDPDERADCTMYTSTEPCEMCAAAIHYAGLDRVVYSVSGESLADLQGKAESGVPCRDLIERKGGTTDVDGPVLESEGRRVHQEFYG
jgi:tRNA(Arg) A34 adenosine deaminase TadA